MLSGFVKRGRGNPEIQRESQEEKKKKVVGNLP